MDLGLADKRAVVTGASGGLGFACSAALAAEGADLMLFARGFDGLAAARAELVSRYGVAVTIHTGDVTRRADVAALAEALRGSGGVDILVLNTPRPPSPMRAFLDETEDERWEEAYRNQLHGALNLLRTITPLILENEWGRIIAITSASVKQPMPRHAVSSVFRAGVQAALKHLANEIGAQGVTVNAVAPAGIATPTFGQFHDVAARVAAIPVQRLGTAEEVGALVAFLASRSAGFLTGQVIQIDGGVTGSLV